MRLIREKQTRRLLHEYYNTYALKDLFSKPNALNRHKSRLGCYIVGWAVIKCLLIETFFAVRTYCPNRSRNFSFDLTNF